MRNRILGTLAGALLVLGVAAGCGGTQEAQTGDSTGQVSQAVAACCSSGAWICEATGDSWDYDPPRCGLYTWPQARDRCVVNCPGACVDTGMIPTDCFPPKLP